LDLGKKLDVNAEKRFLDVFALGEVLGQGSFGIVYACRRALATKELAVKMVDKVECPIEDIKREVALQQKLNHPNVVKVHEVYYEKCFVCIVMDIFRGGDLMEALEYRWETRGSLEVASVVHVHRQMVAAIALLHSLNIAHRDVKGDNFMLDRADITDPQCRVALGDFGTAWQLEDESERLHAQVGTSTMWAPEFFDSDYGMKADIWALGTVIYGMIEGSFPFNGQHEICQKAVAFSRDVPSELEDFVRGMLCKDEVGRLSAEQLRTQPWLSEEELETVTRKPRRMRLTTAASFEKVQAKIWELNAQKKQVHIGKEEKPSAGVQGRRQELVTRMQTAAMMRSGITGIGGRLHTDWFAPSFEVRSSPRARPDGARSMRRLSWMGLAEANNAGVPFLGSDFEEDGRTCKSSPSSSPKLRGVRQILADHGIDTAMFGQGSSRSLEDLAAEVQSGASRLMLDATAHRALVRVVDLVLLHISAGTGAHKLVLVQQGETFPDGRQHCQLSRLPGGKRQPHENLKMVVGRIMSSVLGMSRRCTTFDYGGAEVFEKAEDSVSFPGVRTVYRTELVYGHMDEDQDDDLLPDLDVVAKFSCQDELGQTRSFSWLSQVQCLEANVALSVPQTEQEFSSLVQVPVGLDDVALREVLESSGVALSAFALDRLSAELVKGESALRRQPDGGRLLRVVNLVLLKLTKTGTNEVLVDCFEESVDGVVVERNCLPGGKQRPDENHFLAAQRILQNKLGIDQNCVSLDSKCVCLVEEHADSPSYPGLLTLYRRRIIRGSAFPPQPDEDVLSPSGNAVFALNRMVRSLSARSPVARVKGVRWSGA